MIRGQLITLEGIEGAGKSSQIPVLVDCLESAGRKTLVTREPGGTEIAEAIRTLLLSPELPSMHMQTELLLMFAARNEHLQKKILPALAEGVTVICDRFTDASYAYQGGGRSVDERSIAQLETWVQGDFRPDLTLLFDIEPELGLQRVVQRGKKDRFEQEELTFFSRVRAHYLQRAEREPERFRVIQAHQSLAEVSEDVQILVSTFFKS